MNNNKLKVFISIIVIAYKLLFSNISYLISLFSLFLVKDLSPLQAFRNKA